MSAEQLISTMEKLLKLHKSLYEIALKKTETVKINDIEGRPTLSTQTKQAVHKDVNSTFKEENIMIINYNSMASNALRQLNVNTSNQAKSMAKLSSGLRINSAADDAAGLAISEKMKGQIRGLDQSSRNAQDGISLVQTAEGALSETTDILQRMRELAVQSASDTNTDADRANLNDETTQLISEIDRIGNNTQFNTQDILKTDQTIDIQVGANKDQTMTLSWKAQTKLSLGEDGINVSSLTVDTKTNAQTAIDTLDKAIASVSKSRSLMGAYENRLDHTINNLNTSSQNISEAQSRIADVDMAKEMMNQSKSSVLAQAAQAMLAQANQQPQQVLQLLRG